VQIPPDEVPQVMRCPTQALADFARKHQVTMEWLISGDLKALLWMTQQRRVSKIKPADDIWKEVGAAVGRLPNHLLPVALAGIRLIAEDKEP
jgi:hypothetical protein